MAAADISNFQPGWQTPEGMAHDLTIVNPQPSHIITRLSHESLAMRVIAQNQLQSTLALKLWPGGYGWSYGSDIPDTVVSIWQDLYGETVGANPKVLWIDAEGEKNIPDAAWMSRAFNAAAKLGMQAGIYSTYYWLRDHFGATQEFLGQPCWMASYGVPYFQVTAWGGMHIVGHQFTSSPYDRSVFLPEAVGLGAAA